MKQSTFSAVMANNIQNLWQRYSKSLSLLLVMFLTLTASTNVWGATTTTYTFSSKSWAASQGDWTSEKDGNQMTSGRGIQVTTGVSGANATSPESFTNVSKVVVTYSTNASNGAGSIKIKIGTNAEVTKNVTKTGGTNDRTLTYDFSPNQTGNIKVTVTCSTNSIYIKSIAITEAASAVNHTVTWNVNGDQSVTTQVTEGSKPTFPTTPSSCDATSTTFYGWATATWDGKINDTNGKTIYTSANEMPAVNGAVTYYAVFAKATTTGGGSTSKQYSFDITPSNFNSTSYAANNNEKTSTAKASDGSTLSVKWTSYQVMLQSSAMQWQKSAGYIYNSTDLGTINSVTVTKSTGTFTTYYGTSKQPSSSTTVGNGYFQIKVGSATGQTSKVTITFTKTTQGAQTTTYSDYLTTCASTPTPTTNITLNSGLSCVTNGSATVELNATKLTTFTPATRTGFTCSGYWSAPSGGVQVLDADGDFAAIDVQDFITDGKWTCEGDVTLTPRWECSNTMTLSAGEQSGGTYSLSKTSLPTCDCTDGVRQVTITATPNSGYSVTDISYSGNGTATKVSGPTKNGENTEWVYQFNQEDKGTGTFTVTFTVIPTYTVTLVPGSGSVPSTTLTETSAGAGVTLTTPTLTGCGEWTFAGWAEASVDTKTTEEPTLIPAGAYPLTSDITLYAVYQRTEEMEGNGGGTEVTKSVSISNYATANSWANATKYTTVTIDENITATASTGTNTGKYYESGTDWRFYQTESPKLTISAAIGCTIKTVKVTYSVDKTGVLTYGGTNVSSGTATTINATSATFGVGNTGDATNGQVCITAIEVTYTTSGGGSTTTTYYHSTPECGTPCTDAVNVTKGISSNGSFTMVSGYQSTCNGTVTVTLSNIEPATGYQFSEITQSGVDAAKVTINNTAKTVTYAQNTSGTSIINVTFIEIPPTYTVTWMVNGEMITPTIDLMFTTNITSGNQITLLPPPPAAPAGCSGKVFVGWTTEAIDSETDTPPSKLYKVSSEFPVVTENVTYYAVWADETLGSGSGNYELVESQLDDYTGDYLIVYNNTNAMTTPNGSLNTNTYALYASIVSHYSNKVITSNASTDPLAYTIAKTTNGYSIYCNKNDAYLAIYNGTTDTGSKLRWNTNYSENECEWTLVTTNGTTEVKNVGSNTLSIRWNNNSGSYRFAVYAGTQQSIQLFKKIGGTTTHSAYITSCCQEPTNPLTVNADKTELVKSGVVTLTATGGNGRNITWTTTGGVLSNQSNTGATLTISDVDATQNITVTATQAVNDDDDLLCAQEASIDITVKAQWTITFWTNDNGNKESNSMTVTDGESYTMPDISDEYICTNGHSFAGWVDNEADKELDAMPNSTQTATADQTWYAAWSSSSATETVDVYQLVTDVANLAVGDKVWITDETPTVAMGSQNTNNRGQVGVVKHPTENDKIYSKGSPVTLTIGKDEDNYTFHDDDDGGYLYAASSSSNHLKTQTTNNANGKWSISITDGKAKIIAQGTNTRNTIRYNQSNNPPLFSCYASGQKDVKIYKYVGTSEIEVTGATITTNNTSCTRGAVISAENGKWVTSANGQKVRMAINVTARGFESNSTLTASSNNEHFNVSVPNSTINASTENITTIVVEYTPVESDIVEMAEITLKAGEATKIISINGRSLPDEFVIVAQYGDKWLALPANMQSGADQYNGIEVTPNNALTQIPAAPNTTIYSLRGVAETRYETAGVCVRLVGNGNKCLWGNTSNTTTTIQNWTTLSKDNGENYEWLLTTSDGEQYTIACPAHPEYSDGRVLANSGQKYGLYKGTTNFYIMPVGCSALPGNVQVSPRRVDANFAWVSNASSMQIDVWTNEEMTEGKITQSTANSQYFFSGLKEKTQYWYKLTPDGNDSCAVIGTFTTTGPTIDVVEWKENAVVIQVDKDDALNPLVIIDGEVEHGVGGTKATDIFFSKYFETQGTAKLLAIYNGTANAISLSDIQILHRDSESNKPLSLATFGKTKGWIQPGEEVILYNVDSRDEVMKCAEADDTFESWNNVEDNNLAFSGKGTIRLFRGSKCIDIIGAMENGGNINDKTVKPKEGTETPGFDGDATGFSTLTGDYYKTVDEEKNYALSTNRCLLVRKPSVTSGAIAVEKNIGDFKTLGNDYDGIANEWAGLQVPNGPSSDKYKYTCEGFQEVGSFDYNKYYKEYNTIDDDTYLENYSHDVNTNEYTIPIENLANYSCLNLRFQLKQDEEVLTETPVQVPIIVSGQKATNDAIFNAIVKDDETPLHTESIERCKTCNVVVLSEATLTKATDETTNDVAQVHNVKVYPGGKLVIPVGTNYNVNSLSFRRQEEEVASAELKGNLNITASSDKLVYVDVRVNAENWHWFTLPYDCNIADVTWADGTPAKYGVDWFLSTYDGEKRAATQSGGCWAEYHGEIIKAGVGYIVGIAGHPTKSKVKYELRFPMNKEVLAQEVAGTDKTVPVNAWGVDEDMRPTHKGWNLVGNPYLDYYKKNNLNSFGGLRLGGKYVLNQSTGYYEDSGEWDGVPGNLPYVVIPLDGGWSAYDQVLVSSIDLLPFTAYFVQVGNPETEDNGDLKDVLFDGDNRGRASIARRAPSSVSEQEEPVIVGVSLTNSKGESDKTSMVIDDKYTDEYEMNADFFKWFGDYYRYYTKPVLYTIGADKQQRAFNALNEEQAAKPISMGTYTAQNGEYTFSLDRRSDLTRVKEVWLHDATESAYVNLMQEDYSFATGKTDGTGRFTLAVTLHPKAPTDITDGMNGQVYVTSHQRMLYVNNLPQQARVWVYDAVGKLLVNETTNVYQRAYHLGQAGVYFVRVQSQNGCETLQAVVE